MGKPNASDIAAEDDDDEPTIDPANTPATIFGGTPVDTAGFRQAVNRAYEDPLQRPTREVTRWKPIEQAEEKRRKTSSCSVTPTAKVNAKRAGTASLGWHGWPNGACGACSASCCWCCC